MKEYLPKEYLEYIESIQELYAETNIDMDIEFEPIETIVQFNKDIEIETYAKGLYAFACDGGNEIFAFDKQGKIFIVPLVGMSLSDAKEVASSWAHFKEEILINA